MSMKTGRKTKDIMIRGLFLVVLFVFLSLFYCNKKSAKPPSLPPAKCSVSPTAIEFGYTTYEYFTIKNEGEVSFSGHMYTRNEKPSGWNYFYIVSERDYTLEPGDSIRVKIRFDPKWRGISVMEGTIETGNSACNDVYCTGS